MSNISNIDDIECQELSNGDFAFLRKSLSNATGGKKLGAGHYILQPGKKAFPFHCHYAVEEAIFILDGEGTLRLGNESHPVKKNDYIALPVGRDHAHQLINTSNAPLTYLCMSTMEEPDVMEYPDSNKVGLMTGTPPGGKKDESSFKAFYKKASDVDYFSGES